MVAALHSHDDQVIERGVTPSSWERCCEIEEARFAIYDRPKVEGHANSAIIMAAVSVPSD
jgi:hypothetical protein